MDSTLKNKTFFVDGIFSKNQYLKSYRAIFETVYLKELPQRAGLTFARNNLGFINHNGLGYKIRIEL